MGWIGVGFDGSLARYERKKYRAKTIGEPVPRMVKRIKNWLDEGKEVRVFTSRCYPFTNVNKDADLLAMLASAQKAGPMVIEEAKEACEEIASIREFCHNNVGEILTITCVKDKDMIELWDDKTVQIEHNTGIRIDGKENNHVQEGI